MWLMTTAGLTKHHLGHLQRTLRLERTSLVQKAESMQLYILLATGAQVSGLRLRAAGERLSHPEHNRDWLAPTQITR
jgi:hypothetical protein